MAPPRARRRNRLFLETLESRQVLSTIAWNTTMAPTGGDWNVGSNWVGGTMPGSSDTAVINLSSGTVTVDANDSVLSLMTNSTTTLNVTDSSLTLGAATSTIGGSVTVSATGTLALNGATLVGGGTVTDAGHLTAANTALDLSAATMSSGSVLSVANLTVGVGATLSAGADASITIGPATSNYQTVALTDNGTLSFGLGDSVSFNDNGYYYGADRRR